MFVFGEGGGAVIHPSPNPISWSFNDYITFFCLGAVQRAGSTTGLPLHTLTLLQDIKIKTAPVCRDNFTDTQLHI